MLRKLSTIAAIAVAGLVLTPGAAHADGWRTATAQGFGPTQSAGSANAQNNARAALTSQAAAAGEVCTSVTSSATLIYVVPSGGGYQFSGTATGYCAPPVVPVYDTPRSATAQGGSANPAAAQSAAYQSAASTILAAGHNCTGWSASYSPVYIAPGGAWYIYSATVSATCVD